MGRSSSAGTVCAPGSLEAGQQAPPSRPPGWQSLCIVQTPAGGPEVMAREAGLLTLNDSLVLLSGCLQMTTMTTEQRRADPVSTKPAHSPPSARAFFPRTATVQKVTIRIAKRERQVRSNHLSSSHRYPQLSPKPMERQAPFLQASTTVRTVQQLIPSGTCPPPPMARKHVMPTRKTLDTFQGGAGSYL